MTIQCFDNGILDSNVYVLWNKDTKEAILIDTGVTPQRIFEFIQQENLVLKTILLTHCHYDHIYYLQDIYTITQAKIFIHETDFLGLSNPRLNGSIYFDESLTLNLPVERVKNNDLINAAGFSFKVLHTPGHSLGSICLYTGDTLFSGDTLFHNSIGRTDLEGCDPSAILPSIVRQLLPLPEHTIVYPGHGTATTIGQEKKYNPFLQNLVKN